MQNNDLNIDKQIVRRPSRPFGRPLDIPLRRVFTMLFGLSGRIVFWKTPIVNILFCFQTIWCFQHARNNPIIRPLNLPLRTPQMRHPNKHYHETITKNNDISGYMWATLSGDHRQTIQHSGLCVAVVQQLDLSGDLSRNLSNKLPINPSRDVPIDLLGDLPKQNLSI